MIRMSVNVNRKSGRGAEARQRLCWLQTLRVIFGSLLLTAAIAAPASAQVPPTPEQLCDNAFEDCRAADPADDCGKNKSASMCRSGS